MRKDECCGTCKWSAYEKRDGKVYFYCGNENSDNCGVPTFYDDTCDEWEERDTHEAD